MYAKTIMVFQSLVILFFGFWMYQEYQYSTFFQLYVNGFFADNELFLVTVFAAIGFLLTGLGMYGRSHGRGHSLELTTETSGTAAPQPSMRGGKLDSGTEQHLIDMIRKTVPVSTSVSTPSVTSPAGSGSVPAGSASDAAAASGQRLPTLQRAEDKKKI